MAQEDWSPPITISDGVCPDFDIDRNTGHLHIVSMYDGVIYTETDSAGNILIQEEVPETESDWGGWNFGASIAVDNDGLPYLCYRIPVDAFIYHINYKMRYSTGWGSSMRIASNVYRGYMVRLDVDPLYRTHIVWGNVTSEPWGHVSYICLEGRTIIMRQDQLAYPDLFRSEDRVEIDASGDGIAHLIIGCPNRETGPVTYYRSNSPGSYMDYVDNVRALTCTGRNGSPDLFKDQAGNVHICYGSQTDFDVGGRPSIRYVRYEGNTLVRTMAVTKAGWLEDWKDGNGWGLASVAASDDGQYVAIAYVTEDGGDLYVTFSSNGGTTWADPTMLASDVGGFEGRNKHLIRAYQNNFYVVYPSGDDIKLRYSISVGDVPPDAAAGGPYSNTEGNPVQFNGSASTDEGPNQGIIEYAWDWDGDGVFDFTSPTPFAQHTYPDDFNGQVILRVMDRGGKTDYDTASVQIANVNPTVYAGQDRTGFEGDTLYFSAEITDPGSDSHTIVWRFESGSTKEGTDVSYSYADQGNYNIVVTVTDDDGGSSQDNVYVILENVNPTVDAGGPYAATPGESIHFIGSVYDPGTNDTHTYHWDLNNDGIFETRGREAYKSYSKTGQYIIWLRVMDDDGGAEADTALVRILDDTPIITPIPDQTIDEGEAFSPIQLDLFVDDPFQSDDQLVWNFEGNQNLIVTLTDRILTLAAPHSEWSGSESITLTVTDPKGFEANTEVKFTINAVNDPPQLANVPDYAFNEDDTLKIPFSALDTLVTDVDDDIENLVYWITGNNAIQWKLDVPDRLLCLYAPPNWFGHEDITFGVSDTSGASDQSESRITVHGMPDPPDEFLVIDPLYALYIPAWPDSLVFQWHATSDPDLGTVYYEWTLQLQGGSASGSTRSNVVQDTALTFYPDANLQYGTYLWWVSAYDQTGLIRKSKNLGIIIVRLESDVAQDEEIIPTEFNLLPNWPNPFNPRTQISYHLPKDSPVRLVVYNSLGQEIRILDEGRKKSGIHTVLWDARDQYGRKVPTGVYFYRLTAGSKVFLRKMMLIQ